MLGRAFEHLMSRWSSTPQLYDSVASPEGATGFLTPFSLIWSKLIWTFSPMFDCLLININLSDWVAPKDYTAEWMTLSAMGWAMRMNTLTLRWKNHQPNPNFLIILILSSLLSKKIQYQLFGGGLHPPSMNQQESQNLSGARKTWNTMVLAHRALVFPVSLLLNEMLFSIVRQYWNLIASLYPPHASHGVLALKVMVLSVHPPLSLPVGMRHRPSPFEETCPTLCFPSCFEGTPLSSRLGRVHLLPHLGQSDSSSLWSLGKGSLHILS